MQRNLLLLAALACAVAAVRAQTPQRIGVITYDRAPLYDSANYMSPIIGTLRKGDTIGVLAVVGKYYRTEHRRRFGYVLAANVVLRPVSTVPAAAPANTAPVPAATNPPAARDTGRVGLRTDRVADSAAARPRRTRRAADTGTTRRGADSGSAAAQHQCTATTKAGRRCTRATADASGLCWQHRPRPATDAAAQPGKR